MTVPVITKLIASKAATRGVLKKPVFKNFANCTRKYLRWSSKALNFIKKRLQHKRFSVKFENL